MQDCPSIRTLAIDGKAIEQDDSPPIFDEDPLEKGIAMHADEGELFVTRHILNIAPIMEDDWHRKSIFRTCCTVYGKVCDVIIDGGSWENVVSQAMVEKFALVTVEHPHPYNLAWLKKSQKD
jgi:hypothetical protein